MAQNGDGAGFEAGGVAEAFANQVEYCRANGAPLTARIVAGLAALLGQPDTCSFIAAVREWQGSPLADAVALRAAGGLRALYIAGSAPELAPIYAGDAADDVAIIANVTRIHAEALLPWLDGPPQTNEAGRSSGFIAALLWLARQGLPARFECLEIGSSAGINLMIDRYFYNLGGIETGPSDAAMHFAPEWRGPAPPRTEIAFASLKGCDVAPVDLTDATQALRLKAYIWPEHKSRFKRLETAIAMAREQAPDVAAMMAADFVDQELARPQEPGTTRVLMHSIVMQYVPQEERARIASAMADAGRRATADKPLAWIALEGNRKLLNHGLMARYWPGGAEWRLLAAAHAHGAWLEWFDPPVAGVEDQVFF